ncbi:MAG TPA: prephenate dehydrogenase [Aquificales bacterium]|nr:prephenate dehydrogenase [Aquificales bacterium]
MEGFVNKALLIVGLGFMGGSLARGLRKRGFEKPIYGLDINPDAIRVGKEIGVIDDGWNDYDKVPWKEIDFVVLASPVGTFERIANQLKDRIEGDTTVSDLGSTKRLVYRLEKILPTFVGAHPIAGTEKSGVIHSVDNLYEGKKLIITPTEETDKYHLQRVENLWKFLGAKIEYMSPELHDFVFGAVSHLPHAVAFALVDALRELSEEGNIDLFKYPGAGFKDFTRIAASDPTMWRDIFLENKDNLLRSIRAFKNSLERLERLVENGEGKELREYLNEISLLRRSLD